MSFHFLITDKVFLSKQLMMPYCVYVQFSSEFQEALSLLHQLEVEEKHLYKDVETSVERERVESPLPPPPVLIARAETSMKFRPPSYKPPDGQKVVSCHSEFFI